MRTEFSAILLRAAFMPGTLILGGCSAPQRSSVPAPSPARADTQAGSAVVPDGSAVQRSSRSITQVRHASADRADDPILPAPKPDDPTSPPADRPRLELPDLIDMTVERNPRLAQVTWVVEAVRGQALQAGLYPNPYVGITGNELGDKTGPGGIWTTPMVSQEIVTANKLGLSKAAVLREVDQASLGVINERYRLFTDVRQNFFELIVLQRRVEVYSELVGLAEKSVDNAARLLKAKEVSNLDLVQLEFDLERYRADLDATKKMLPAAYRQLVASVGVQDLPYTNVMGDLETPIPNYDLEVLRVYILGIHPEVRSAQIGVERAQIVLRRAEVEPIPNLFLNSGYTRQNQNKSSDWDVGVGLPVPLWNRNQGNIRAAKAQVDIAFNEVVRVENELVNRLAAAYSAYASSRKLAERYKSDILPKAEESYRLSMKAYQGGQFEYLRVLQAQRAVAEARLAYLRTIGEMWKSASVIAGLMLEDRWPLEPAQREPQGNQP